MATIRDSAAEYEPQETKNITELKEVSTEMEIFHKVVNEGQDDQWEYDYIVVNGEDYRVPKTVLKQLKAQLEAKHDSTSFKVTKKGEGKKTEYTVIMLD